MMAISSKASRHLPVPRLFDFPDRPSAISPSSSIDLNLQVGQHDTLSTSWAHDENRMPNTILDFHQSFFIVFGIEVFFDGFVI